MTAPTLATIARRAIEGEAELARGSVVLVAVSGGPDSMALLDVLATLAPKRGVGVFAHGVDHGLRREAAAELDRAEALAHELDVPFGRTRVDVARGGNVQARAREARYEALAAAARACRASAIATAHHADDRAETVLLRLLRGAGARGLAVLPARAPLVKGVDLVRPLLRARRADILTHLDRHAIPFATDPSNADPRYVRTRVRREVLPLLESLDPQIVRHLADLADDLGRLEAGEVGLPRATQRALVELLRKPSASAQVWLPGGLVVQRRKGA
ncbi:MAG TPA: tRNA lysidine(34) synthetase TilS [Labilithrix sp.]